MKSCLFWVIVFSLSLCSSVFALDVHVKDGFITFKVRMTEPSLQSDGSTPLDDLFSCTALVSLRVNGFAANGFDEKTVVWSATSGSGGQVLSNRAVNFEVKGYKHQVEDLSTIREAKMKGFCVDTSGNSSLPVEIFSPIQIVGLPKLTSPSPSVRLPGSTVTFTWVPEEIDVYKWHLGVGTDLDPYFFVDEGLAKETLSYTVTSLPTDGSDIHVKFWYLFKGGWHSVNYIFKSHDPSSAILLPPENLTLE